MGLASVYCDVFLIHWSLDKVLSLLFFCVRGFRPLIRRPFVVRFRCPSPQPQAADGRPRVRPPQPRRRPIEFLSAELRNVADDFEYLEC